MENTYQVLVVDDIVTAAQDYANIINAQTGLSTIYTSSPREAIKIVQYNDIKVLVLDQIMPEMTGTELLSELRQYTKAKALMLTGEASKEDLGKAINLRFDGHLDKAVITQLSDKVRSLYAQFEEDFRKELQIAHPIKTTYSLIGIKLYKCVLFYDEIIVDSFEEESARQTLLKTFVGQDEESTSEVVVAEDIVIENSQQLDMNASLEVSIQKVISKFGSSFSKSFKQIRSAKKQRTLKNISKYHLTDDDAKTIDHRVISYVPIYEVHKMVFGYKFPFVGNYRRNLVIVKKFTGKYQLYQIDYLKDGSDKKKKLSVLKL